MNPMPPFASGPKQSYYGKGDVLVYRLYRDGNGPAGQNAVFGANVKILIYGAAFWPTYTTGDNTNLIATDSMKNFVQRETMNFTGGDLESYCFFLADKFLARYPQAEGVQLTVEEAPWSPVGTRGVSFAPSGPDRAFARLELARLGGKIETAEVRSGIRGFKLLRLGGSAFHGFVRDEYTTLPDIANRPLHMWLDLDWGYANVPAASSGGAITAQIRSLVIQLFDAFTSGSIQEIIYQIGSRILADIPAVGEVSLEANNRTWDTISEKGDSIGIYTDARPPYGCLGLTLRR
jgi:urate oxidase / 2-oxo-4-hydroxy-4-carboxy-5-ureidoimidazoline decarboxylase